MLKSSALASTGGRKGVAFAADGKNPGATGGHMPETPVKPEKPGVRAQSGGGIMSSLRGGSASQFPPPPGGSSGQYTFTKRRFGKEVEDARVHMTHVANDAGRPRLPNHHSYTFPNGDSYVGEWRDGMIEGVGAYTRAGGKEVFEGDWLEDKLAGRGRHAEESGFVYEGGYKDGIRHGRAKLRLPYQEPQKILGVPQPKAIGDQVEYSSSDEDEDPDAKREKERALGGMPRHLIAGAGTLGGAAPTFDCEWREGVMMGKGSKVWYRLFDAVTGKLLEGEEGRTIPGYINTLNQPTGNLLRPEALRRYDLSAGGRRYEFPPNRGGFNPVLDPPFREHSPRTEKMLSKGSSVYKDPDMKGWGDVSEAREEGEEVYEGDLKLCLDGVKRRYGKGTAKWGIGHAEKYSGEWLYDKPHGKGERIWGDGKVYNGVWRHGKMDGKGSYRWPDGAKYNGEFVQGRRSGYGVQLWTLPGQGVMSYAGEWSADKRHGLGKLNYPDGRSYDGGWFEGKMQGKGVLMYASGWTYQGEFHADFKHGRGIRTEWYGPGQGHGYQVQYTFNVLTAKKSLGAYHGIPIEEEYAEVCKPPSWEVPLHPASPSNPLKSPGGHDGRSPGGVEQAGSGGASKRNMVPRLNLLKKVESATGSKAHGVELPVSPPRSPPFSPTDNNMDHTHDADRNKYPAGNWTFGERAIPEDEEVMTPRPEHEI